MWFWFNILYNPIGAYGKNQPSILSSNSEKVGRENKETS